MADIVNLMELPMERNRCLSFTLLVCVNPPNEIHHDLFF